MARGAARRRHPFLEHDHPIPFAHRGGEVGGLENSMVAFQDAYEVGYRYFETDLHATADGVLVAFHDESLDRVTDATGLIAELPYEQVATARIGGQEPIPRFDELLASFPDVYWNLDVKADPALGPLLQRLAGDDELLERSCIGAFSDARLISVRTVLGERVCTSAGPNEVRQLRATSLLGPLSQRLPIAADCVQIPTRYGRIPLVDRVLLSAARDQDLSVHVWTINDEAEMRRLLALGVDGIFTDATRTLRAVLEQRGEWSSPEHDPQGRPER
jgi:glycerophosphoryl diester phosphodiesterase